MVVLWKNSQIWYNVCLVLLFQKMFLLSMLNVYLLFILGMNLSSYILRVEVLHQPFWMMSLAHRFLRNHCNPEKIYMTICRTSLSAIACWCPNTINTLRPRQDGDIFRTTFSNAFYWMKMFEFGLKYHWSLFLRVQLTISQHWFT